MKKSIFYVLTQSNLAYVIEIELKFKNDTNTPYITMQYLLLAVTILFLF